VVESLRAAASRLPGALAEGALDLAVGVSLGDCFALVVLAAALGETELDLRFAVLEVEAQRDQGEALLTDLVLNLVDLLLVEQEAAGAARLVAEERR
jgi:hypothetical protein